MVLLPSSQNVSLCIYLSRSFSTEIKTVNPYLKVYFMMLRYRNDSNIVLTLAAFVSFASEVLDIFTISVTLIKFGHSTFIL